MIILIRLLDLYMLIIFIRVLFSWITVSEHNPFVQLVYTITEPVLNPIRQIIPPFGGFDISPVILIFGIYLIKNLLF